VIPSRSVFIRVRALLLLSCVATGFGTSALAQNYPPNPPSDPRPPDGIAERPLNTTLFWRCTDPDNDPLTYDVYFGTDPSPPLVASNVTTRPYDPGPLAYFTLYYWKVVARDPFGNTTPSVIWSFWTRLFNYPPTQPANPKPENGFVNQSVNSILRWLCIDSDGDELTFDIFFGTSSPPPLVATDVPSDGPNTSYAPGKLNHLTTYFWQIEAQDSNGATTRGPLWRFTTTSPPRATKPSPPDGVMIVASPVLYWDATDPGPDELVYDVSLGTAVPLPIVASGLTEPEYDTGSLPPSTYFWQIFAHDGTHQTVGPVWSFTLTPAGDVVMNGVVDLDDAACAMDIFLWNPACGGQHGYTLADVNCNTTVTPADARCLHLFVIEGSCILCGPGQAPPARVASSQVTASTVFTRENILIVRLSVGEGSLGAFGFYTSADPKLEFVSAVRHGLSADFDVLEANTPDPGMAVVGAYALAPVWNDSPAEFIELQFDLSNGPTGHLVISGFVDDLQGAGNVVIALDNMTSTHPVASGLVLHPNRPNPFNPQTTISYSLSPGPSKHVRVTIVDASGRIVRTLVDEELAGGLHEVHWEGRDADNEAVASGVYFCVLDVAGERRIGKLVLLK
jgi:hypothetical protein